MPDIPDTPPPATLLFERAMTAISQTKSVICRRAKWGNTPVHVFTQNDADSQKTFIVMGETGVLFFYDPTPEDILSSDWQVISLLH
ncbi:Thoeris anti-defense Tad2 family protein [Pantoea agglomerans]|uniref:Thoeris anti-defense Tad2 family protein n=1 Tax=Enterobacter agglomerans TaxID=549 RepID=UPI003523DFB1